MATDAKLDEHLGEVLARYDGTQDARLQEVSKAVISSLHHLVRALKVTRDEWFTAIQFLTATGQKCSDIRQEFILMSDTLGVSTLIEMLAYDASSEALTDNTVLGPFYVADSPERGRGDTMLLDPDEGDRVVFRGRVTDVDGNPLENVVLDCWQNATNMFYAVQQPGGQSEENLRGIYRTAADGTYEIRSIRPVPYPIPSDGPVGDWLKRAGRNWWRPGHLHIWVKHPGFKDLITHVFDVESEHLEGDAVFGVQRSLIREFTADVDGELETRFDIVLDRF